MGLIIGKKNPKLVKSEDIGNLARMNYGKPVEETAIGKGEETPSEGVETAEVGTEAQPEVVNEQEDETPNRGNEAACAKERRSPKEILNLQKHETGRCENH